MEKFNHYFLDTLKNRYADFNGKATRSQYWYFVLFYVLLSLVLALIDIFVVNPLLGINIQEASTLILQTVFALALIIPTIAIGVRRLHDIGKSGWWMLISFVPIIGFLVLIFFFVQESK